MDRILVIDGYKILFFFGIIEYFWIFFGFYKFGGELLMISEIFLLENFFMNWNVIFLLLEEDINFEKIIILWFCFFKNGLECFWYIIFDIFNYVIGYIFIFKEFLLVE